MFKVSPKTWLKRFRNDEAGSVMVEAVICMPLVFWTLAATYEFFEVHRYASARDKASYTIADMISREMQPVTPVYMDNAKTVFDMVSNDTGDNQLRVTIVKYDVEEDEYTVKWSEVRGDGGMLPLEDADAEAQRDRLPLMNDGEEVIVIDAASLYAPFFRLGVIDPTLIESRVLTSPRFAPQIVWDGA